MRSTRAARQHASQAELIHPAATSQDEHDGITFQQSVNLNNSAPYTRIIHLDRLTVSQTRHGIAVVPIQWELRSVNADGNYSMYRERFSTRSGLEFLRLAGLRR